jgi:hypothetical protein
MIYMKSWYGVWICWESGAMQILFVFQQSSDGGTRLQMGRRKLCLYAIVLARPLGFVLSMLAMGMGTKHMDIIDFSTCMYILK